MTINKPMLRPWETMPNLKQAGISLTHGFDSDHQMYWIKLAGGSFYDRIKAYSQLENSLKINGIEPTFFGSDMRYFFKDSSTITLILLRSELESPE